MAQLKSTVVQGALTVTGNAVASKLIKIGGTSDHILMADGSTSNKSDLMALINAAVTIKGTLGTGGTITSLPTASASNLGYGYKVITAGTYDSVVAKIGDMFICYKNGSSYAWMHIPSGDDIEDTWRPIQVNGTQILANGNTTGAINLVAGTNITLTNANGSVTFDVADTGATFIETTGTGNAVTSGSYDASTRKITLNKENTFVDLSSAQTITGIKTFVGQTVIKSSAATASADNTVNGFKFLTSTGTYVGKIASNDAGAIGFYGKTALYFRPVIGNDGKVDTNYGVTMNNTGLFPGSTRMNLGTSTSPWGSVYGTTIYENGTSLAEKYQAKDDDLTAIAALTGTSGFLKKTAANTWALDTNAYLVTESDTLQTVTSRGNTTTNAIKIQNGAADGCLVLGGNVGSTGVSANTRKLARVTIPDYANTSKTIAIFSADANSASLHSIEFGSRHGDATSYSPNLMAFSVGVTAGTTDRYNVAQYQYNKVQFFNHVSGASDIKKTPATDLIGMWEFNNDSTFVNNTYTYTLPDKTGTVALVSDIPDVTGFVKGPSSATDNAVARFDSTTGKIIQNSSATIDDSGNVKIAGSLYVSENKYAYFGTDQLASFRANQNGAFIVGAYDNIYFRGGLASNDSSSDSSGITMNKTVMRPEKNNVVDLGASTATWKDVYAATFKKTGSNDNYILLGGGGHKAISDFLLKNEVDNYVKDATITISAGSGLADGGSFTLNQNDDATITITHGNTSDVENITEAARTYVKSLTFDEFGHVTGYTTGSETVSNTDTKVTQTVTSSSNTSKRPLILGMSYSDANPPVFTTQTDSVYASHNIYVAPKDGYLYASKLYSGGKEVITDLTGYVTGTGLTADTIILGSGNSAVKTSSKKITTTLGSDDTTIPTSKAVKTYADSFYWANIKTSTTSSTNTAPIFGSVGISDASSATASMKAQMKYDNTDEAIKFIFI